MSESITLEDIYKLFEKTNEQLQQSRQEFDRRLTEMKAENDRRAVENDRRATENERRAAEAKVELDRWRAENERRAAEAKAEAAEAKAENERRAAKAKAEAAEAKAELDRWRAENESSKAEFRKAYAEMTKAVQGLTTRWGRFVEELVEPGVIKLFRERGIDVKETFSRARVKRQGLAMEIDILAVDETELVAVECKSRLSKDDVNEFLEKLRKFKQAFPQYNSFKVYGAVAGIEVDEGVDRYAYKQGLFVIKPSGDTVKIVNDTAFKGKFW